MLSPPAALFARRREWNVLADFISAPGDENRLAVVLGRRRQGKSMLVRHIAEAADGRYFEATQQSAAQNLADLSRVWAAQARAADEPGVDGRVFPTWAAFTDHLAALPATGEPKVVVLDEVGYLVDSVPELPSLLQRLFTERPASRLRVILCGSAFAQMRRMLAATAPLRGRQHLTLQIDPFDYRTSAEYWGLAANPAAAFRLHALIGGTPAYRRLTVNGPLPTGNVDDFVVRYLLEPASVLYAEGRAIVGEDPALTDQALYSSVLNAVADGARRRSEIAERLDRPDSSLHVAIETLVGAALLEKRPDPFHRRATVFVATEPMLRTERVLIAPERSRIERGRALEVWQDAQPRVARLINGPHLEWMAAEWLLAHASPDVAGGVVRSAGPATLAAKGERAQLDVVAVAPDRHDVDRVCLIGECKAGSAPVGIEVVDRLDSIAARLGDRATDRVKRLVVARGGFTAELQRRARSRPDLELATLDRLYHDASHD